MDLATARPLLKRWLMPARRRPALRPAFVVITAAIAAAACGVEPTGKSRDRRPDTTNPPAPPPVPLPAPSFGEPVSLASAPPALGGATVVTSEDGATAAVSDPDRDRVLLVDLASSAVRSVELAGDEPGRLAIDAARRVHVVLRRSGMVATIDGASGSVLARRPVCGAPQGIAIDGETVWTVCAGGEIVRFPTAPGDASSPAPTVLARIDPDLRDVVIGGGRLLVSRLRSAEVLHVEKSDGTLLQRSVRAADRQIQQSEPFVGWRLAKTPEGAALVHQMARTGVVQADQPGAYSSPDPCGGTVDSAITTFTASGAAGPKSGPLVGDAVAPVDMAASADGRFWAVIAAGNGHLRELPQVHLIDIGAAATTPCAVQARPGGPNASLPNRGGALRANTATFDPPGQAVAVAFTPDSQRVLVFTREPAALHVRSAPDFRGAGASWTTIALGGDSREDTGHAIFHSNSGGRVACVSCHPGGADDGHVWNFADGARRTQSLQGTLEGTAPYHWGGDVSGLEVFASDVFVKKMAGPGLTPAQVDTLRAWLVRIPAAPASAARDAASAERGKALFTSEEVGCSSCHSGAKLTNNASVDVGTGGLFQVPSLLGVGLRAPYLHDGRAKTLEERFAAAGGGDTDVHGSTSQLGAAQIQDLVTYLKTL